MFISFTIAHYNYWVKRQYINVERIKIKCRAKNTMYNLDCEIARMPLLINKKDNEQKAFGINKYKKIRNI